MLDWLGTHADLLMSVAMIALVLVTLPTIRSQQRTRSSTVPLSTSLPMVGALALIMAVDLGLSLWISSALTVLQASMWFMIAWQRWRYGGEV